MKVVGCEDCISLSTRHSIVAQLILDSSARVGDFVLGHLLNTLENRGPITGGGCEQILQVFTTLAWERLVMKTSTSRFQVCWDQLYGGLSAEARHVLRNASQTTALAMFLEGLYATALLGRAESSLLRNY